MRVLILCTGNSCRSQMAHGFLQSFDEKLIICSAGTKAAGKLNDGAVKAMAEVGIDISSYTSDPVEKYLAEFVESEFRRVRDEIRRKFHKFYTDELMEEPSCPCGANYYCKCE